MLRTVATLRKVTSVAGALATQATVAAMVSTAEPLAVDS
jgi:hypothetical protein